MRGAPPDILQIAYWMAVAALVAIGAFFIYQVWVRIPNLFTVLLLAIVAILGWMLYSGM